MESCPEVEEGSETMTSTVSGNCRVIYVIKSSKEEREGGEKSYKCSACDYADNSTSNVYKHMNSRHKFSIIRKLDGSVCKTNVTSKRDVIRTVGNGQVVKVVKATKEEVAKGERLYRCTACGKSSNTTSNLYRHMESVHKGCRIERINRLDAAIPRGQRLEVNALKTPSSNKVVKIVKSSDEEMAAGEKQYKCSECGKGSDCTGNLYAHMDVAHPDCVVQLVKPSSNSKVPSNPTGVNGDNVVRVLTASRNGKMLFKCSLCCMVSSCTSNLYKHMRRQHKGFGIIKKCKKNKMQQSLTRQENDYDVSRKVDSGVGDNTRAVEFSRNAKWFGQESKDYGVEAYECSVCMETFNNCHYLDIHVKLHKGENCNGSLSCRGSNVDAEEGVNDEEIEEEDNSKDEGVDEDGCVDGKTVDNEGESGVVSQNKSLNNSLNASRKDSLHISVLDENVNMDISEDIPSSESLHSNQSPPGTVTVIKTSFEERKNGGETYQCSRCDRTSNYTSNLYRHMEKDHKNFQLEKITESFRYGARLEEIISKVSRRRSDISSCGTIGGEKIVKVLVTPKTEKMNGDKRYRCSECSYGSNSTSNLYKHMRALHQGFVIHKIKPGGFSNTFKHENYDIVRILKVPGAQSVEGEKTTYQCSKCGFESIEMGSVYNHVRNDHKGCVIERIKGELTPPAPGDKIRTVGVVKTSSVDRKNGKKMYECSRCPYSNDSTSNLYKHMKSCHVDCVIEKLKEVNRYYDLCDANSAMDSSVVRVIKVPSQRGPLYKCSKCSQTSNNTSNLYKHMNRYHPQFVILKKTRDCDVLRRLCRESLDNSININDEDDGSEEENVDDEPVCDMKAPFESYECSVCMETFSSCEDLDAHTTSQHL